MATNILHFSCSYQQTWLNAAPFFFPDDNSTSCLISQLLCRENFSSQRHFNITGSKLTEFRLATNLHFTTFEQKQKQIAFNNGQNNTLLEIGVPPSQKNIAVFSSHLNLCPLSSLSLREAEISNLTTQ